MSNDLKILNEMTIKQLKKLLKQEKEYLEMLKPEQTKDRLYSKMAIIKIKSAISNKEEN